MARETVSGLIRRTWMSQRVEGSRWPGPSLAASALSQSLSLSVLLSCFMRAKDSGIARGAITAGVAWFARALRRLPKLGGA
jgi:hypothetical protein